MDLGINLGIPLENIKAARTDNQTSINNAVMHMLYLCWFKGFKGTIEEAQHTLRKALIESDLCIHSGRIKFIIYLSQIKLYIYLV